MSSSNNNRPELRNIDPAIKTKLAQHDATMARLCKQITDGEVSLRVKGLALSSKVSSLSQI